MLPGIGPSDEFRLFDLEVTEASTADEPLRVRRVGYNDYRQPRITDWRKTVVNIAEQRPSNKLPDSAD